MPGSPRKAFTLIELLIVVVVIGLIAAIAIPKFGTTKGKAYAGSLKSDLRNVARLQEIYFNDSITYTKSLPALGFHPSKGVTLTIQEATSKGWSAHAIHAAANPLECAVFVGNAAPIAPATKEGLVTCN